MVCPRMTGEGERISLHENTKNRSLVSTFCMILVSVTVYLFHYLHLQIKVYVRQTRMLLFLKPVFPHTAINSLAWHTEQLSQFRETKSIFQVKFQLLSCYWWTSTISSGWRKNWHTLWSITYYCTTVNFRLASCRRISTSCGISNKIDAFAIRLNTRSIFKHR